ncbi:glycine zipper family protein [Cupriavidus pauculus]|uniref:Glycine-zipper-containing OmpA-like membrane domain-containing protein n=1 Tax=Cupriavidus pauculus TaxID=82633 RepID=A0A2N5CB30_9BURK|nr:glycine zipper family protein [Cupriavidus pauculus]PLP99416.1 hypothetical protein CYJ10_16430 [Cupriavidus pauculus]
MSNRPDVVLAACTAFVLMSGVVPGSTGVAHAQVMLHKPVAYPARGQSAYQQSNDDGACYSWATRQTGTDPYSVASMPAPVIFPGGERVRGAAGGAAAGAVVGAIGGDAGKGAAAGAAMGTIAGGVAHRQQRRQAVAASAQTQANNDWAMTSYWQAWRACMTGRGYSVQ